MPVVIPIPPQGAFNALRAGLDMLAQADDHFAGIEMASPVPHPVSVCRLDDLAGGNPLPNFARSAELPAGAEGPIWRFFVRSNSIPKAGRGSSAAE